MSHWLRRLMTVLALASAVPAAAELDALAFELHQGQSPAVRWDNLEGRPYIRGDGRVRFDSASGRHRLRLSSGETATLALPADSDLMLVNVGSGEAFEGMAVWRSTDGAAWRRLSADQAGEKRRRYRAPGNGAYRVRLVAPADDDVAVAAFRSRRVEVPEHPLYRRHLTPHADSRLRLGGDSRRFRRLGAGETATLTVEGPTRLALEHRRLARGPRARLSAPYSLTLTRGDAHQRIVAGRTRAQRAAVARLDGQPVAVGTREMAYWQIPDGEHKLRIEPDAPVLLRVRGRYADDTLASRPANWTASPEAFYADLMGLSTESDANPAGLERVLAARLRQPPTQEGGLAAAARLQARAEGSPFPGEVTDAARSLAGAQSFWRELAPTGPIASSLTAYADAGELAGPLPADPEPPVMVANETPVLAASHQAQSFHTLSGTGPDELVYPVPERGAPSRLRLAIHRNGLKEPVELAVRIGGTTHRLRVTPRRRGRREPEPDLAALRLLPTHAGIDEGRETRARRQPSRRTAGTLSGAFSALAPSAPLVATARVELALPPGVDRVAVAHRNGAPVRVSAAYRAAKGLELDETGYREAVAAVGGPEAHRAAFTARLRAATTDATPPAPATAAAERLAVHHTALLELLAARYAGYTAGIEARGHRFRVPAEAADPVAAERFAEQARSLEAAGHWGAAARAWGEAARAAGGEAWRRAELARIAALERTGAEGLADRLLRGFHLYTDDATLRARAFERLRERLGQRESDALLIGAHVAEALRREDLAALAPVVGMLLAGGDGDRARDLAALLGASHVPAATRARAYHAGDWPEHGDAAVADLQSVERNRWRALAALGPTRASSAAEPRAAALPEGEWSAAVSTGRAIAKRLRDGDTAIPYADWLAWEATHPGGRAWRGADDLIASAAARPTVRALRRETLVTPALAKPDEPVELVAPAGQLRLTLRLKLQPGEREQAGWARIRVNGSQRVVPVSATGPSGGLEPLAGGYGLGPGRRAVVALDGTTGRVSVEVDRPMLVTVEKAVPSPRLPLLPDPRPSVMAAIADGEPAQAGECRARVRVARARPDRVRSVCGSGKGLLARGTGQPLDRGDLAFAGEPARAERLAAELAACQPPYGDCTDVAQRIYTADRLGEDPEAVSDLLARIGPFYGFERVEQVVTSAGVRPVEVRGWRPHSPQLRARRPFLGRLPANAEVLSGPGSLYVDFVNRSPTTLLLDLRSVDMPTYPRKSATVRYRLDGGRWRQAEVTPGGRRLAIDVGSGRHAVELTIADPTRERYLVVTPRERRDGRVRPIAEPVERTYELATRAEPAVFAVEPGALVRVDRYRDGTVSSEHRRLDDGADTVRVTPQAGDHQALVRVYELRHRGEGATSAARYDPDPVPEPAGPPMRADLVEDAPAAVGERVLHGQEDGTTSVGLAWRRRQQAADEPDQGGDRDGFMEARVAHRYWDPVSERYYSGGLIGRARSDGRPTFGAVGEIAFPDRVLGQADWLPLDLTLDVSGFMQATDAEGAEAAVTARAAARHQRRVGERTTVSVRIDGFARHLTLDEGLAGGETADADVFTRYKDDHPVGWGLGGGVTHAPYLDTRLYGRFSARSNPELVDADNIAGEVGVRQFVDGWRVDAAYREARFLADDDRSDATSTRRLELDVAYELWRGNADRLELTAGVRQDLRRSDTSLGISLDWHFGGGQRVGPVGLGNGRLLRDFRPGTTGFRSLREARYPGWAGDEP